MGIKISLSFPRSGVGTHFLFVYGTLRRNEDNEMSRLLAEYSKFVANASYRGKLYKIDDYPGAVRSDDPNDLVLGEVYLLDQAEVTLALLDRYEEIGPEFPEPYEYSRLKQNILLENGDIISAWVYVYNLPSEGLELIFPSL